MSDPTLTPWQRATDTSIWRGWRWRVTRNAIDELMNMSDHEYTQQLGSLELDGAARFIMDVAWARAVKLSLRAKLAWPVVAPVGLIALVFSPRYLTAAVVVAMGVAAGVIDYHGRQWRGIYELLFQLRSRTTRLRREIP